MTADYLIFLLGGRLFGTGLGQAVEIIAWRQPKRVPMAYSYVEGLLDYRGMIYPVFNIEKRLGLKPAGPIGFSPNAQTAAGGVNRSILLLKEGDKYFGISVDSVRKMARFDETQKSSPQAAIAGIEPRYIRHIASGEDGDIIILDFERLLFHGNQDSAC